MAGLLKLAMENLDLQDSDIRELWRTYIMFNDDLRDCMYVSEVSQRTKKPLIIPTKALKEPNRNNNLQSSELGFLCTSLMKNSLWRKEEFCQIKT